MFRIKGGTRQLVAALGLGLDQERVRLGHAVSSLAATEAGVRVEARVQGRAEAAVFRGRVVVTTLPPSLLASSVTFSPPLPEEVAQVSTAGGAGAGAGDQVVCAGDADHPHLDGHRGEGGRHLRRPLLEGGRAGGRAVQPDRALHTDVRPVQPRRQARGAGA